MIADYPVAGGFRDSAAENAMQNVIEIIRAIRNIRAEYGVEASKWIEIRLYADSLMGVLKEKSAIIEMLARAQPLKILDRGQREEASDRCAVQVLNNAELVIPLANMIDIEAERKRTLDGINEVAIDIERLEKRLADESFLAKAPDSVIAKGKDRLGIQKDKLLRLQKELNQLR
jgi:valyl-tRNA synthetase